MIDVVVLHEKPARRYAHRIGVGQWSGGGVVARMTLCYREIS